MVVFDWVKDKKAVPRWPMKIRSRTFILTLMKKAVEEFAGGRG